MTLTPKQINELRGLNTHEYVLCGRTPAERPYFNTLTSLVELGLATVQVPSNPKEQGSLKSDHGAESTTREFRITEAGRERLIWLESHRP